MSFCRLIFILVSICFQNVQYQYDFPTDYSMNPICFRSFSRRFWCLASCALSSVFDKLVMLSSTSIRLFDSAIAYMRVSVERSSPSAKGKEEESNEKEFFNKIDGFVDAFTDLSSAMYDIDYDFAEDYPLEKSFHDYIMEE